MQLKSSIFLAAIIVTTSLASDAESRQISSGAVQPSIVAARNAAQLRRGVAEADLKDAYPRVNLYKRGANTTRVFGQAFSSGASAVDSAEAFRQSHAQVFGVEAVDLRPHSLLPAQQRTQPVMYDPDTDSYKFTLVYYTQYSHGIPVFRADLRLLVRNEPGNPLVLASSGLRTMPGFEVAPNLLADIGREEFVSAASADGRQAATVAFPMLVNFSKPKVVIWAGVDDMDVEPRTAVVFVGDDAPAPHLSANEKWLFVTDIATGQILYQEDQILEVDVVGNVSALATEGSGAEQCEAEVLKAMPHARVNIGGTIAFADVNGDYVIPNAGGGSVTVDSGVRGQYFRIFHQPTGAETVISTSVTPPGPLDFLHNDLNTEFRRGEVNAYIAANEIRDFVLNVNPAYPVIGGQTEYSITVNEGAGGFCPGNAQYQGNNLRFCAAGGSAPNTAWSSVVYHEYGHHLVAVAGSGQGQYGEGTGDVVSILLLDESGIGFGFFGAGTCNTPLRESDNTRQYPCVGEVHDCGELLAACVWHTRDELLLTNPGTYLNILSNLAINAILLHTGSDITPQITIDWLTLDDDDANLGNGTPHYAEICAGFGAHNMDCPPLSIGLSVSPTTDLDSSGDVGGPFSPDSKIYTLENLGPGAINYNVNSLASWLTITNGAGSLPTVGSTALVTVTINANATSLPQGTHTGTVSFTNTTDGVGNTSRSVILSIGVPDDCVNAQVVCPGAISDTTAGRNPEGSASCGTSDSSPDMWYSYTPDANGSATFSLCSGTNYDSVMSVHSGCPGTIANELACDDDTCSAGGPSSITLGVTAGTEYLIRVTGWNGSSGDFTLTITGPTCVPTLLSITYPGGRPQSVEPGVATSFDVSIQDGDETYQPGTAMLHYRYDGGAFQTAALVPLGGDLFEATLPAALCTDAPEFYINAQGNLGSTVTSPSNAPTGFFSAAVGTLTVIMNDNFETDQGWVATNLGATTGDWERGVPVNDPGWANDPVSDSDGSGQCYLTQNQIGNTDVDNGAVELVSPTIDMSSGNITISYDYFLRLSNTDGFDRLLVEISSNGDAGPWTEIARHDTDGALNWRSNTIPQAILDTAGITMTANMKLRFNTNDAGTQSINESGLDAFLVTSFECTAVPCPGADGDLSLDGSTNGVDIQLFVDGVINGGTPDEVCRGDFDGLNGLDIGDINGMVNALLTAP